MYSTFFSIFFIFILHFLNAQPPAYKVLGFGPAFIDCVIPIEEDFLQEIEGEKGGSAAIEVDLLDSLIKKTGKIPFLATGGSCCNTIKALRGLGEKVGLISQTGSDAMGDHFIDYMNSLGVVGFYSRSHLPTARLLSLVTPDGQRTMRFCANSSQDMSDCLVDATYFEGVELVHLEAYTLRDAYSTNRGEVIEKVMRFAQDSGAKISIDLSSFEICRDYRFLLLDLLSRYATLVFGNEEEVSHLTSLSAEEGFKELQKKVPIVVLLKGKQGCSVAMQGKVVDSPSFPVKVIDTTGAGDYFAAGFLYSYLRNQPLEFCANLGNRLGSSVIQVKGTELPQKTWDEIKRCSEMVFD